MSGQISVAKQRGSRCKEMVDVYVGANTKNVLHVWVCEVRDINEVQRRE